MDFTTRCELQFPSQLAMLRPALALVRESALAAGLDPARAQRTELATEEVLSNIIRHGYAGRPNGQIVLQCQWNDLHLTLGFIERGLPFDFGTLPAYDPGADGWDPTGLGMHLVRQCVDEVVFENLGQGGKLIRLVVRLDHSQRPFIEMPEQAPSATDTSAGAANDEVQIRRMTPDDALSLAQCAYRTWGYGYNDFIYHPGELRSMLADGRLDSVVAVRQGRVIGHTALKKRTPDACVAEAGVAFVDPEVRSQSLMARMTAHLEAGLGQSGLKGIYAMQVTSHTISQRIGYAAGFRDCGLLLRAPARQEDNALAGSHGQRRSAVVLCFRPHGPQRTRKVYPPAGYRVWVEEAYAQLGLPVGWPDPHDAMRRPSQAPNGHPAHVRSSRTQSLRTADIEVLRHGHDTLAAIRHARRMHDRVGVDTMFLHLNLEDAQTAGLDKDLQAMGFIFAGVLPFGLQGHDALILQLVNLDDAELDAVQLLNPFPKSVQQMARASLARPASATPVS